MGELTFRDQILLSSAAMLHLKVITPVLATSTTAIDNEGRLHVVCGAASVVDVVMQQEAKVLRQIWLCTGCTQVTLWFANEEVWQGEYTPVVTTA